MDNTLNVIKEIDETEIINSIKCDIDDLPFHIKCNSQDFSIITQNIRSIYKNIDDLQVTLSTLTNDIDIIILTECRLNVNKPIPCITNYISFQTSNLLNQNDGVVLYAKNNTKSKINEIKLQHASCLQVETNNYTIIGIYRSPSNHDAERFIDSLNQYLETIKTHKNIIIMGDININIIPKQNENNYDKNNRNNYLNMLGSHGILPGHLLPTREDSCLDHCMIKLDRNTTTGNIAVLNTTITDHCTIYLKLTNTKNKKIKKYLTKTITKINYENAIITLANNKLDDLILCDDPNTITEKLINIINESIQENTKEIKLPKSKRNIKPWITPGILKCIKNRNDMQKRCRLDPCNETLKITYHRYRNFCNNLIKKLKRKYDKETLNNATNNNKTLWKNIKTIANLSQTKMDCTELLNIKPNPIEAVNYVNNYFGQLGQILANDITNKIHQINQATSDNNKTQPTSFVLLDTSQIEVYNTILSLKSDSAPGWDGITSRFLKQAIHLLTPVLCHLVNLCFNKGVFPSLLKQSIITPVYKSGDRADANNYRPISVLPSISKIIEKLINTRILNYLNKFNIISASQYGFRGGVSTEDAVVKITSRIVEHLDHRKKCLTVFLDLKKAFDTVSVPILLHKLENVGIRGVPLLLLKSYLTDRKQRVKINQYASADIGINFGIPQGSVLGPTLFLVYINELCNLKLKNGQVYSYADDTAIVFTGSSWKNVHREAELELSLITNWLEQNLLTLNTAKSQYICFSINNVNQPKQSIIKIHKCPNFNNNTNLNNKTPNNFNDNHSLPDDNSTHSNQCSCPTITKVEHIKYLGIIIDQRLSWHKQIELVAGRVRKLIWVFKTLRHIAPKKLLIRIYTALAQSIITYCIPVWGGASKIKFLEVERAQRSLLKIMFFKPYRFPTNELYTIGEVLTVRKLYIAQIIVRKQKTLIFDPGIFERRRKDLAAPPHITRTAFANNQYDKQSTHLYNKINGILDIYPKRLYHTKNLITKWIKNLMYDEIESLLKFSK